MASALDRKVSGQDTDIAMPVMSREVSMEDQSATDYSSLSPEDRRIAALGYKPVSFCSFSFILDSKVSRV